MGMQLGRLRRHMMTRMVIVILMPALLCAVMGNLFIAGAPAKSYDVVPTAAIDQSSSTLGFADSDLSNTGMTSTQITEQLTMMQSLGVKNVRILIPWADIEKRQGEYSWDYVDSIVESATNLGMGILGVISQTPSWAGTPILAGMPEPEVFGAFAQAVATHYVGQISTYEIWNEPNAQNFLDPVDPAAYTTLLQAAYPLMKQADPNITVIGGVVGAGASEGNVTMDPDDFVQGMYAAGAKGFFDALSFHPYAYSLEFSAGAGVAGSPLEQLQQIFSIMAANNDSDHLVWATEYGQPTTGQYTTQQQADFIQDFLNSWPEIAGTGPMFIYTLQDTDSGSANKQDNFGVYYSDGTAKPVVQIITDYLDPLDPTDPTDPTDPGPTAPGNPLIQAISAAVHWLGAAARTVINGAVTVAAGVVKVVAAVVRAVVQATGNAIRGGIKLAKSFVAGLADAAKNVVTGIKQAVRPAASSAAVSAVTAAPAARSANSSAITAKATGQQRRAAVEPSQATGLTAAHPSTTPPVGEVKPEQAPAADTGGPAVDAAAPEPSSAAPEPSSEGTKVVRKPRRGHRPTAAPSPADVKAGRAPSADTKESDESSDADKPAPTA